MENLFSFMDKAGPVGFIIVATSIIALCIVLDRVWAYRLLRIKDPKSLHRLCKRALEGHLGSAADAAKGETHPLFAALLEVHCHPQWDGQLQTWVEWTDITLNIQHEFTTR